jgi:hypothetical protein
VHRSPAVMCRFDELECHHQGPRQDGCRGPW